jgi:hypothetical protein
MSKYILLGILNEGEWDARARGGCADEKKSIQGLDGTT